MQFLIVASALLGVAFGQLAAGYTGYPGLAGYQGLAGYKGYPAGYQGYPGAYNGYPGYQGYDAYKGYPGYTGYGAYPALPGFAPIGVKPVDPKVKDVLVKPIVPIVPALPSAPIVPVVPKTAYTGPYPAIRSQTQEAAPDGTYSWSFATDNGIQAAESGAPRSYGPEHTEEVVVGEYAYTSPEGVPVHVRYTADGNGFHPEIVSTNYNGYYGSARGLPLDAPVVPVIGAPVVAAPVEKKENTSEQKE